MHDNLSPPASVSALRILLHVIVGIMTLWFVATFGGLEYLSTLSSEPESVKTLIFIVCLLASVLTIFLYDRLFLSWVSRHYGHDPHDLHWTQRLNRDGSPFCPDCKSLYLYKPDHDNDAEYVRCGDCGFAIAPLGEMRPFFEANIPKILEQSTRRFR